MANRRTAFALLGVIWFTCISSGTAVSGEVLNGDIDHDSKWGSSYMDLSPFRNFRAGTKLRITLEDRNAICVLVRLLGGNQDPSKKVGIVGGPLEVGADRTVLLELTQDYSNIKQISVHGKEPWGQTICPRNGSARINSIRID
jgi:hypothetical protein